MLRRYEKGDTLIEVLFAVTVFSLIIVTSLSIMNQGLASAQRSLEVTQVRQQIDGQAETLRFMHDSYVAAYQKSVNPASLTGAAGEWYKMITRAAVPEASQFGITTDNSCPVPPVNSFIVDPATASYISSPTLFKPAETIATLTYDDEELVEFSQGLWVELVRSGTSSDVNQVNAGYVDFHIRACWDAPGLSQPMNIGTIVRLYEPRG